MASIIADRPVLELRKARLKAPTISQAKDPEPNILSRRMRWLEKYLFNGNSNQVSNPTAIAITIKSFAIGPLSHEMLAAYNFFRQRTNNLHVRNVVVS